MTDEFVKVCPYCGSTEVIEAYRTAYGAVSATSNKFGGASLYHSVCRNCGSVLRSYVKEPEKLLKKKDRKKYQYSEQKIPVGQKTISVSDGFFI